MSRDRIIDRPTLLARLAEARAAGATVALTNGAFDLLHVGHVRSIRAAAALADVLVVAINSDASVRALKGPRRPIVTAADRAEVVAALEGVDWVILFDELDVEPLLRATRPDIHAKGRDYAPDRIRERGVVEEWGGRLLLVGHGTESTSAIERRILAGGRDP